MNKPTFMPRSILGADRTEAGALLKPEGLLPGTPDLLAYARRIMARKWLVMAITVATIVAGVLAIQSMTPVFEATATVLIEDTRNEIVQIRDVYSGTSGGRDHFTTQSEFIDSRNVAERVIKQLDLMEHPDFDPRQGKPSLVSGAISWVRGLFQGNVEEAPLSERDLLNSVVRTFSANLVVTPLRATQLVKVRFSSPDPVLAAEIANAIVDAYIAADMDARYAVAQQAHLWLSEHVAILRQNLTASELALQGYRDRKGLIDKDSAAQGGAARELETIMQRLVEARVRRSQAEQQFNQIRGRSVAVNESAPAVLANPSVARAREVLAEARRRMADASMRYGPSHPQYQAAETDLVSAETGLQSAVEAVTRSIAKEFETARAVERSLERELADSRGVIQEQNRDEFELATYEQEVATNRQLYETFLARLKETNIVSDIQSPVARMIDRAVPPSIPAKPAKRPLLLAFGVVGLVLGIASALLVYRLDDSLSSVDEVEDVLSVPVISVLPRVKGNQLRNVHRMLVKHPESGFSEAIRTARSAVRLATLGANGSSVIMVTSSLPDEGKSTIALNMALAQARVSSTLLIECDIRRPTHAQLLGQPPGMAGLTDCLKGTASAEDCIFHPRGSKLDCLAAGRDLDAPQELLLSKDFAELLRGFRSQYEMIFIDTPPVALVSDAVTLAEQSDGVILTVKAHATSRRLVQRSLQQLARVSTPLIGVVLNQLDVKRARRYYGEYGVYDANGYGGYRRTDDAA